MSEDNKKKTTKQPRTLHVDTLHIHANEIVFHQDQTEGAATGQQQMQPPQQIPQNQIPRDFWGFPIRQIQAPPQATEENANASEEAPAEGSTAEGSTENNNNDGSGPGPMQGPPLGWI